jgi:hypothetical protein
MKKSLACLLCFFGMIFTNCGEGDYIVYSSTITIENKSSLDLNVRFSPEKIQIDRQTRIYGYNPVDVKKGESVSFTVTWECYIPQDRPFHAMSVNPIPNEDIKKIIFSRMENKELIKEVNINSQNSLFIRGDNPTIFILKITDELLSIGGE